MAYAYVRPRFIARQWEAGLAAGALNGYSTGLAKSSVACSKQIDRDPWKQPQITPWNIPGSWGVKTDQSADGIPVYCPLLSGVGTENGQTRLDSLHNLSHRTSPLQGLILGSLSPIPAPQSSIMVFFVRSYDAISCSQGGLFQAGAVF